MPVQQRSLVVEVGISHNPSPHLAIERSDAVPKRTERKTDGSLPLADEESPVI